MVADLALADLDGGVIGDLGGVGCLWIECPAGRRLVIDTSAQRRSGVNEVSAITRVVLDTAFALVARQAHCLA